MVLKGEVDHQDFLALVVKLEVVDHLEKWAQMDCLVPQVTPALAVSQAQLVRVEVEVSLDVPDH